MKRKIDMIDALVRLFCILIPCDICLWNLEMGWFWWVSGTILSALAATIAIMTSPTVHGPVNPCCSEMMVVNGKCMACKKERI